MPRNSSLLFLSCLFCSLALLVGLWLPQGWHKTLMWPVMLIYLGATLLRYLFFFIGVAMDEATKLKIFGREQPLARAPVISIIVPAYNEEAVIREALESLLLINYSNFEVIVIDDGSHDHTFEIASALAHSRLEVPVRVVRKENGGKASALNLGLMHATGSLILCVDADSRVHPDSLSHAIKHFRDEEVGAVAGFVELAKQSSFLLKCQQLEYQVGLNFLRRAYSFFGVVPIVPGPVGLFRREVLVKVGGYTQDAHNFAEDAELSLRLLSEGWTIRSEPGMVAYTEAPERLSSLLRQRYRWNRGTFQALQKNWHRLTCTKRLRPRLMAYHLLSEVWVVPLANMILTIWFSIYWLRFGSSSLFTIWMAMLVGVELLVTAVATSSYGKLWKWFAVAVASRLSFDILLFFWRIVSLFDEWTEKEMSWDKLTRTGALKFESKERSVAA